jgi:hypothetical protein
MKRITLAVLLVIVPAFAGTITAQGKALAAMDIRQAISELSIAAQQADRAEVPLENLDKIKQWDSLIAASGKIEATVQVAIRNADATIASFKVKAEKYQSDPAKADVFKQRIEGLQAQADALALLDGRLCKAITSLKSRLDGIRADPDVKAALEAQSLTSRVDAALQSSSNAVPAYLKE